MLLFYVLQVNPVTMERSTTSDTASEKPNPSHHSTGAVQMRIKNANSHHDRLSQSKSMILSENMKVAEPVSKMLLIFSESSNFFKNYKITLSGVKILVSWPALARRDLRPLIHF